MKRQECGFFFMLLGTLGASVLGNMSTGKWVIRAARGYNKMNHMDKNF